MWDAWAGHDDAGAGVVEVVERGDVPDVAEVERVLYRIQRPARMSEASNACQQLETHAGS